MGGTAVSSDIISGKICLVFFNTAKEQAMEKLKLFDEASEKLSANFYARLAGFKKGYTKFRQKKSAP